MTTLQRRLWTAPTTFRYVMLPNEILMYFRAQRKHQGDVSLSDALDGETEGGGLSLMDVLSVDDDMLEQLDTRESCARVRGLVGECLTDQEQMIITSRYGLDNHHPKTQREIAALTGISRSYAPVNIGTNNFYEKGHLKTQVSFFGEMLFETAKRLYRFRCDRM